MLDPTPARSRSSEDADWWRQAVVYQVYPRSFADSDGDGLGDLPGVTSRASYLADLGVDAVWLSPFYPSALADGGYDVDDHRAVDPRLGTLDDFDAMVAALDARGIRVVVDIVPNHTSDRHRWFREALAAPAGSRARQRYHFRAGRGPGGELPPNDWESIFGGPAWHRTPDGEWYHHIFAPEQPDLNWDDEEVRDDFDATLRFWADRGVAGFRVDVAHGLVKDLSEPYLPQDRMVDWFDSGQDHPWWDRDEVHEVYTRWRSVFDEYDPPRTAVAEAWVPDHRRARYASPEGLGQAFDFALVEADWSEDSLRSVIGNALAFAAETESSTTWVLSNHDVVRHATRYGLPPGKESALAWLASGEREPALDRAAGLRRARAATLLMLALPGASYLYQGEELGLHEVGDLPEHVLQDPIWQRTGHRLKGRDGCRVPLPWEPTGPSYGFGTGPAHLPQPAWFATAAASAQIDDPSSTLGLYREALRLRRRLLGAEELDWCPTPGVLHLRRPGGWESVTNLGSRPVAMPAGDLLLCSSDLERPGELPADSTAWLLRP